VPLHIERKTSTLAQIGIKLIYFGRLDSLHTKNNKNTPTTTPFITRNVKSVYVFNDFKAGSCWVVVCSLKEKTFSILKEATTTQQLPALESLKTDMFYTFCGINGVVVGMFSTF